jgi:hypothetical protein
MTVAALLCLAAPQVFAAGFGFYGMTGVGSTDWDDDYTPKFSTDSRHRAFGMSLDTGLSSDRFFNYHLNLGREKFASSNFIARGSSSNKAIGEVELDGMVMSHTFGFGMEFSDTVKLWMGPEIRWHWVKGSPSNVNAANFDLDGAGFGFGPSMGVNFNFPSGLTLLVKAGYIMSNYSIDGKGDINGTYSTNNYHADENFTYVMLEFLFRTPGDRK